MKRALLEKLFGQATICETHLSLVVLKDDLAWKWKKSVHLPFVDQSTAARRRELCFKEVELNRAYAPSVYLGVGCTNGEWLSDDPEAPGAVEWCVRMRRFRQEGDKALAAGLLTPRVLRDFADSIAATHATLRRAPADASMTVQQDQLDNVEYLEQHGQAERVAAVRAWLEREGPLLAPVLARRQAAGMVRECHGDLHLSNTVLLEDRLVAFDCLEFNEALRTTDVCADIAFFVMDLDFRRQAELGSVFLAQYLEASGDFAALELLTYFLVYRTMVRAKVHCIGGNGARAAQHVALALRYLQPRQPLLVLMCGASGSGKSFVSAELVQHLPAVRVRSDVERKRLFDLAPLERGHDPSALYSAEASERVQARLEEVARLVLRCGQSVVVDATSQKRSVRDSFRRVCGECGGRFVLVCCRADVEVMRQRIRARLQAGNDPSDATEEVLQSQLAHCEPPGPDEPHIRVDTSANLTPEQVRSIAIDYVLK